MTVYSVAMGLVQIHAMAATVVLMGAYVRFLVMVSRGEFDAMPIEYRGSIGRGSVG